MIRNEVESMKESGKERTPKKRKRNNEKPVPRLDRSKYYRLDATQRILRLRFSAERKESAGAEKVVCDDNNMDSSLDDTAPSSPSSSMSPSWSPSWSPLPSPSPSTSPPAIIEISKNSNQNTTVKGMLSPSVFRSTTKERKIIQISQNTKQNIPLEGIPSASAFHGTPEDRKIHSTRSVKSWCWLFAADNSPTTVSNTSSLRSSSSPLLIREVSHESKRNTLIEGIQTPSAFQTTKDRIINFKRKVSSWCWLQAPDGSPLRLQAPDGSPLSVDNTALTLPSPSPPPQPSICDVPQESKPKNLVKGIPSPSTFHGNIEDRNRSFKRKASRWCWEQTSDGSPATVEITAPSSSSSLSSSSSSVAQQSEIENSVKGIPSPSTFHGNTKDRYMDFKRKVRSWHWVQTSNSSSTTLENKAVAAVPPPPTKLTIREVSQEFNFPGEGMPSPSTFHACIKDREKHLKRRVRGWCWLLEGDGTPNTIVPHTVLTTKGPQSCSHRPHRKAKKPDYYILSEDYKVISQIETESSVSDEFESSGKSNSHAGSFRSSSSLRRVTAETTSEIRPCVRRHYPTRSRPNL